MACGAILSKLEQQHDKLASTEVTLSPNQSKKVH